MGRADGAKTQTSRTPRAQPARPLSPVVSQSPSPRSRSPRSPCFTIAFRGAVKKHLCGLMFCPFHFSVRTESVARPCAGPLLSRGAALGLRPAAHAPVFGRAAPPTPGARRPRPLKPARAGRPRGPSSSFEDLGVPRLRHAPIRVLKRGRAAKYPHSPGCATTFPRYPMHSWELSRRAVKRARFLDTKSQAPRQRSNRDFRLCQPDFDRDACATAAIYAALCRRAQGRTALRHRSHGQAYAGGQSGLRARTEDRH
jgi:hypothetical protein